MAKLHHTAYKKNYKEYILSCIEEDIEGNPITSEADKINYIFDRFNSEYGWRVQQVGKLSAMTDWLQGLALNIEYRNYAIIDLAVKLGSLDENPSEKLQEQVCDNYWRFMANIILSFEPQKEVA
tara:strand:+ start:560 stop:931 length:372 start_codon:yes stop_codon:yes gene_type:complete